MLVPTHAAAKQFSSPFHQPPYEGARELHHGQLVKVSGVGDVKEHTVTGNREEIELVSVRH